MSDFVLSAQKANSSNIIANVVLSPLPLHLYFCLQEDHNSIGALTKAKSHQTKNKTTRRSKITYGKLPYSSFAQVIHVIGLSLLFSLAKLKSFDWWAQNDQEEWWRLHIPELHEAGSWYYYPLKVYYLLLADKFFAKTKTTQKLFYIIIITITIMRGGENCFTKSARSPLGVATIWVKFDESLESKLHWFFIHFCDDVCSR